MYEGKNKNGYCTSPSPLTDILVKFVLSSGEHVLTTVGKKRFTSIPSLQYQAYFYISGAKFFRRMVDTEEESGWAAPFHNLGISVFV